MYAHVVEGSFEKFSKIRGLNFWFGIMHTFRGTRLVEISRSLVSRVKGSPSKHTIQRDDIFLRNEILTLFYSSRLI